MKTLSILFLLLPFSLLAAPAPPTKSNQFTTNAAGATLPAAIHVNDTNGPYALVISNGVISVTDPRNARLNVLGFPGVVGDGVTDDTVGIQGAINTAASAGVGGAELFFPPVDTFYKVTAPLTIPVGITLRGLGATIRAVGNLVNVIFSLDGFNGGVIEGFRFTTDNASFPNPGFAIFGQNDNLKNVAIRSCVFDTLQVALLSNSGTLSLTNLTIADNLFTGDFSASLLSDNVLLIGNYSGFYITGNTFTTAGETRQLLIYPSSNGSIANNAFLNTGPARNFSRLLTYLGGQNVSIANNTFQPLGYPGVVYLQGNPVSPGSGLTFSGNHFPASWSGTNSAAIELVGTILDFTATGNSFGTVTNIPFITVGNGATVTALTASGNQGVTDQPNGIKVNGTVTYLFDNNNFIVGP